MVWKLLDSITAPIMKRIEAFGQALSTIGRRIAAMPFGIWRWVCAKRGISQGHPNKNQSQTTTPSQRKKKTKKKTAPKYLSGKVKKKKDT